MIEGTSFSGQESLILLNSHGVVAAKVTSQKVNFLDRRLREALEDTGVSIPCARREDYPELGRLAERKWCVYPDDEKFVRVFVDIHYPYCLKEQGYSWKDREDSSVSYDYLFQS